MRGLSLLEYHSHKLLKDVWSSLGCKGCLLGLTATSSTFRYLMDMSSAVQKKQEKSSRGSVSYPGIYLNNKKLCAFYPTNSPSVDAPSVVKAQILAGGRGKGKYESDGKGGVRIMNS